MMRHNNEDITDMMRLIKCYGQVLNNRCMSYKQKQYKLLNKLVQKIPNKIFGLPGGAWYQLRKQQQKK